LNSGERRSKRWKGRCGKRSGVCWCWKSWK